ncbi:ATP-dependent DNA ligase [Bacillus sp. ISL-35]|uniref:ATP-dependent DNA ligase n=1 Tax=Bacillus sp. ISL-35 TaxID=2819122 RepID=UPI001BECF37D|nr:RNA ligase family protein [Bacillus sp. ISL-35]MBT2677363.1 ATP-dependent DNA ligase [Bacillus sp. ISL-35]
MFVSPMLLHKVEQPFNDDSYITELKLDGIRVLWTKVNDKVRLYTRHNNDVTSKFPEIHNINLPNGTILDGEIIVPDNGNKPDFEKMMERFSSNNNQNFIQYCVFDIIQFNGERVTSLPLVNRKELLANVLEPADNIVLTRFIEGYGVEYFNLIKQQELEGIVLKRKHSKYQINKRSNDWLKVINYQYAEVFISGIRKDKFGAVLSFEDGKYAGIMEFMNSSEKRKLYSLIKKLDETDKYVLIEPISCKVKYRNLTKAGLLRIPSLKSPIF